MSNSTFSPATAVFSARWLVNTTSTTNSESSNSLHYNVTQIICCVCFAMILIIGTFGNGLVIYYFGYKKYLRRSIPEMLFHYLAIVDVIASIFTPMLYIYWILTEYQWHFGPWACKIIVPIGTIATTTSGGIFVIIAVDRQRTIVNPFKRHYKRVYIQLCVVIAILYAVLSNVHYSVNMEIYEGKGIQCLVPKVTKKSYSIPTLICFVLQDFILIFIFSFTNYRIFSHIKQNDTTLIIGRWSVKRKKETTRIIRLLVVLATAFFLFTLPRDFFQAIFILSWMNGNGFKFTRSILQINSCLKILHTANSCINVFIYFRMHRGFRKAIYRLLLCVDKDNKFEKSTTRSLRTTTVAETPPCLSNVNKKAEAEVNANLLPKDTRDLATEEKCTIYLKKKHVMFEK